MGLLVLIAVVVFIWITNKSLRWRFVIGIALGVVLLFSGDHLIPNGDGPMLGIVLIIGCAVWLFMIRGMK